MQETWLQHPPEALQAFLAKELPRKQTLLPARYFPGEDGPPLPSGAFPSGQGHWHDALSVQGTQPHADVLNELPAAQVVSLQ
ncbi:MAG TPA: hypothetical protein DD624_08660 [Alphaproteobacteria bacterium]|nr:hypothetical protein [Alphaproteobacteria bacterium]